MEKLVLFPYNFCKTVLSLNLKYFRFVLKVMSFYFPIILETWHKINAKPVCFGARDNRYGAFNTTTSGLHKTMKLVHKSGSIKCNPNDPASYWGCTYEPNYGNNSLMTIITNAKKEAILPPTGDLKQHYKSDCSGKKQFYSFKGTNHTSRAGVRPSY